MAKSVGRLVSILYRKSQVYLNAVLKPLNVTAAELPVLTCLLRKDGVSQEELTNWLAIDKAATARAVMSLMKKGYLRKDKDPDDRRANRIYLTETAYGKRDTIQALLRQWSSYLTEGLDEAAVNTMYEVLQRMAEKVNAADFSKEWGD